MPRAFHIERSIELAATPAAVHAIVDDLGRWKDWSPYVRMDPDAVMTLSGPPAGVGAALAWQGERSGAGRMEIVESVPGERVVLRLDFERPMRATNTTRWTMSPAGAGSTRFTWSMEGDRPLGMVVLAAILRLDNMIGKQFDDGLALLRDVVAASR